MIPLLVAASLTCSDGDPAQLHIGVYSQLAHDGTSIIKRSEELNHGLAFELTNNNTLLISTYNEAGEVVTCIIKLTPVKLEDSAP